MKKFFCVALISIAALFLMMPVSAVPQDDSDDAVVSDSSGIGSASGDTSSDTGGYDAVKSTEDTLPDEFDGNENSDEMNQGI
ncbi:MAG: hypothetical protein HQL28_03075 [Candidatus Omnitrophica bacterium]|nr:hypothetical protein [Candidatus Omnitrophota bacterium]